MPSRFSADQLQPQFAGFALPTSNTTYCPNQFFDVCVRHQSRGVVRLVGYLIRKTLGWSDQHGNPQHERHAIRFTELVMKAGISREMIRSSIDAAIAGNFIRCVQLGRPNSAGKQPITATYELRWDETGEYIKDPKRFVGFFAGEGNRTYIPNQFFDHLIPLETLAVIKTVGAIIRFSIGFQTKWGHRRQQIALSYQDIQNYAQIGDRNTLASAIRTSLASNYIQLIEPGYFDKNAGKTSRAAVYAIKWLSRDADKMSGQKNPPGKLRSEIPTGSGQKTLPGERSENPTDIQITTTNNTSKQHEFAVAFDRLREEGFDQKAAQAIASRFSIECIDRQIRWIDQRQVKTNRLGMLRAAIEQNWSPPGKSGRLGRPNPDRPAGESFADALTQVTNRILKSKPNPT